MYVNFIVNGFGHWRVCGWSNLSETCSLPGKLFISTFIMLITEFVAVIKLKKIHICGGTTLSLIYDSEVTDNIKTNYLTWFVSLDFFSMFYRQTSRWLDKFWSNLWTSFQTLWRHWYTRVKVVKVGSTSEGNAMQLYKEISRLIQTVERLMIVDNLYKEHALNNNNVARWNNNKSKFVLG